MNKDSFVFTSEEMSYIWNYIHPILENKISDVFDNRLENKWQTIMFTQKMCEYISQHFLNMLQKHYPNGYCSNCIEKIN